MTSRHLSSTTEPQRDPDLEREDRDHAALVAYRNKRTTAQIKVQLDQERRRRVEECLEYWRK